VISDRARRVIIYTASLLLAPLPAMPFVRGTPEYAFGLLAWGAILIPASLYVVRGELKLKARGRVGMRLLAASLLTLVLGVLLCVGSIVYLARV
jgi:hypothetical protein